MRSHTSLPPRRPSRGPLSVPGSEKPVDQFGCGDFDRPTILLGLFPYLLVEREVHVNSPFLRFAKTIQLRALGLFGGCFGFGCFLHGGFILYANYT
jgi:hypothetical protein